MWPKRSPLTCRKVDVRETLVQKIVASHSGKPVSPGDVVWMEIDVRSARDFGGANVVGHLNREYPEKPVGNRSQTFFTFDCVAPARNVPYATNQQLCREFARKERIKVFDVDRGIGSHVMIEEGLALPGTTLAGTDSHLNLLGSVGALGLGMGDVDIAFTFKAGKTWFEVPESLEIRIEGEIQFPVTAKDVTLAVLKELGSKGALGRAIHFTGSGVESLDLSGRITLCSMATEMGAVIATITPSEEIIRYLEERSTKIGVDAQGPDPDACYIEKITIDVDDLEPLIAMPPRPDNVKKVSEASGLPIDSVFLGSCTNGRITDFKDAMRIIGDSRVIEEVMFRAAPATREVYGELLSTGLLDRLFGAGIIMSNPGCGGCASGQLGMTGKGEVQLSTSNRNFVGKQGAGDTYLVSPATAAASSITGTITDPREFA